MTPGQKKTADWLINGETGISSETMAGWLAFDVIKIQGSHPLDPSDFNRCLKYLEAVPEARPKLYRMADVSPVWLALVARWDEIEACFLDEVGLDWVKARSAPKTYALMRSIIKDEL